ncbi:hypothetical protein C8A05DRAFT_36270 [Staphylotrichum tortipilum]|uniref:Uncharacterized protein n=1 Tax=Staphylotrichum tortipilum TaxID=2831512 RepID=A0AAN6MH81_9PEZI|nr:hypothetical protein C8A05DRAFT_36270 [Staphylotrichum longicolle]
MEELTLLILGAGWTSTFLIPLLQSHKIPFAATTTTGHPVASVPTIPFKFDPSLAAPETRASIAALPRARYILVTFPLTGTESSAQLITTYNSTHPSSTSPTRFIQLGSTGIWQTPPNSPAQTSPWIDRHSPITSPTPRFLAETQLLVRGGCVLNLAGLWGGTRLPRNWAARVAPTKEALGGKGSLHLVHGLDVARAVVALVQGGEEMWARAGKGQRWMVTDGWVYDWWGLVAGWADGEDGEKERAGWVFELMREAGVRALPRGMEELGRCYDAREFWETVGIVPVKGRVA